MQKQKKKKVFQIEICFPSFVPSRCNILYKSCVANGEKDDCNTSERQSKGETGKQQDVGIS